MSVLVDVLPAHRFDQERLRSYLCGRVPGMQQIRIRQFQGGQSNPTFLLEGEGGRFVLRKKPPGALLPSAHQIEREYRIISALYETAIPVPRPVLLCEETDVIGTAFYLMEHVNGRVFDHPDLPGMNPAERTGLYDSVNATVAALHCIDWAAVGLQGFGKTDNYLRRQVERWSKQYQASIVAAPDPLMDELVDWLQRNMPAHGDIRIAHGDFRIGNLLFAPDSTSVAAVLDWELCTLGDPLSDLAYYCMPYHLPAGMPGIRGLRGLDLAALGIPAEQEFVATYCRRTARPHVEHWTFYLAFSFFRVAAIVQGVYARAIRGNASSADAISVGSRLQAYAQAAHSVASSAA